MAGRVVRAHQLEGRRIVVLIGSDHLIFGLGLNRLVRDVSGQPSKSVVPVSVPNDWPSVTVTRSLADYIVGVPAEERPAYPSIGLVFKAAPDPSRLMVAAKPVDGATRGRDFEEGDIVLSVDGIVFSDVDLLLIHLAKIPWGGETRFRLLRAGVEKTVVLKIENSTPPLPDTK
jgi:S1-C subfamily serine protease